VLLLLEIWFHSMSVNSGQSVEAKVRGWPEPVPPIAELVLRLCYTGPEMTVYWNSVPPKAGLVPFLIATSRRAVWMRSNARKRVQS